MAELLHFRVDRNAERVFVRMAEELPKSQKKNLQKVLFIITGAIKQSIQEWLAQTDTRKTGHLINGWYPFIVETESGKITGGVTSDVPYAAIHDQGGTIVAKGKMLTIPLPGAPVGIPARDVPGLFVLKSKGQALLVRRLGITGKIQPLYILKHSVRIKPKHYLKRALDNCQDQVVGQFQIGVEQAVEESIK